MGEIVSSVQFKTVARLRFTDRFTLDFRELSFKEDLRVSLPSLPRPNFQLQIHRWIAKMDRYINYGLIHSYQSSIANFEIYHFSNIRFNFRFLKITRNRKWKGSIPRSKDDDGGGVDFRDRTGVRS